MLSIQTLGTMTKDKVAYYTEMAAAGYYTEAEEPAGQYFGKLASVLNLDQKTVTQEDLLELAKGFDTKGKALVANAGDEHRMGIDLTFSAPKSVSVCFGLAGSELRTAIQKAHANAVKAALTYAEQHFIQVRHGFEDNQQRRMINTGNALFALFEHGSSRSNDPLLHTHAVLMNFSQLKNGEFRCLEAPDLFNFKKALGALYRCELANQLEKLGLAIEGDEVFFKVTKVPDKLCQLFSKRSNEIHDLLKEGGFNNANSKLKQNAALFTRQVKTHQSRDTLYKNWLFEAEQLTEWKPEQAVEINRKQRTVDTEQLLESLTEKKSLFTYPDFLEQVFIHFQHAGFSSCEAEAFAKATLESKAIRSIQHPQAGVCYTTEKQYQLEMSFYKEMTVYSKHAAVIASLDGTAKASASHTLNTEQLNAFQFICRGSGNLAIVQGAPGTGKSTLLKGVSEAYQLSGYSVLGCALAASAADELQKSSGINAQTIDSLLIEIDNGRKLLKKNSVIVVDEAGMVGVKKLKKLLDHAKRTQSKLVLVGDHNQLSPIESGLGFSNLLKSQPAAYLQDIQRQKAKRDRENVRLIEQGKSVQVLNDLKARGLLHFDTDKLRCKFKLVDDWYKTASSNYREALILASTRYDVADLNLIARAKLADAGKLSPVSVQFVNHEDTTLDLAEGERIMFRSNNRTLGVKNGSTGTIKQINQDRRSRKVTLSILLDSGEEVQFDTTDYNAIEYGYAVSIHKSQGKTVDRSFVWLNESFLNKELNYVQMSRSRFETQVYAGSSLQQELDYWNLIGEKSNQQNIKPDLFSVLEYEYSSQKFPYREQH